jgi:processive 1,2-diacylglycerol beta-glucosyltransferase
MSKAGVPADRIHATGFPVHPDFTGMPSLGYKDTCGPFRIAYFPTPKTRDFMDHCRELMDASPEVRLTIVMGRNLALLRSRALLIRKEYAGRVRLIGWTRRIPKLLSGHHLAVGKAGGATVHECIAAGCPMLIHHLVPGQEEGNLRLLESIGGGKLCNKPSQLNEAVKAMLGDDACGWRKMKAGVALHGRKAGAVAAADLILGELAENGRAVKMINR